MINKNFALFCDKTNEIEIHDEEPIPNINQILIKKPSFDFDHKNTLTLSCKESGYGFILSKYKITYAKN